MLLNNLEKRVIDLSYKHKLSHIGSCLCAVNPIDAIYKVKEKDDPFVLSNGHAFLALAVVLEKYEGQDAEKLILEHGTHPNRNLDQKIYVSTGSLGQGLPIALGMALARPENNVYCVTSDGEMAEGSMWETLRIGTNERIENLRVTVVANGLGGYSKIDRELLDIRMQAFYPTLVLDCNLYKYPDYLNGLDGHYHTLSQAEYEELIK